MNVNDIENKIAENKLSAAQVFTQMHQLIGSSSNSKAEIEVLFNEIDKVAHMLDSAIASPTPLSSWDYKQLIAAASKELKAGKRKVFSKDDKALICNSCYFVHSQSSRVDGKESAFGLTPLLCPSCGGCEYDIIPF